MKNRTNRTLTFALMLLIAAVTIAAGQEDRNSDHIVGTWNVTVTFVDCTTGAVIRSFPTLNTFNVGGTMMETPRSLAQRSPGQGVWDKIGGNEYSSVFKFFRSNADGTDNGYQLVRRQHLVDGDTITTTATFQNYNASGQPTTTGCAVESATRLF